MADAQRLVSYSVATRGRDGESAVLDVHVRIAGAADEAAVERVLRASYPALMAGAYDQALLARVLPMMTSANVKLLASGTYYLAETNGEAVGCGGWSMEEPGTGSVLPGVAHIRHFGVAEGWAGRGIGRALYARCEADACIAGARLFECYASLNGEPFYAALGFTPFERISVPMGSAATFPSVHMTRPIQGTDGS